VTIPARRDSPTHPRADDWRERAVAWVEWHCAEQGVPVKVTDPLVLREVAEVLLSGREKRSSGGR
jgi:hypothetical protein